MSELGVASGAVRMVLKNPEFRCARRTVEGIDLDDVALRYPGSWILNEESREVLRLFLEMAEDLFRYCQFPYPSRLSIQCSDGVVSSDAALPPDNELRSAAMAARLFLLDQDATHLPRICNILARGAGDSRFCAAIAAVRKRHLRFMNGTISSTWINIFEVETKSLLDTIFYGGYFHPKPKHRQFVKELGTGLGPAYKQLFARAITEIRETVSMLVPIAKNALGVDLLAQCPCSKEIQAHLGKMGLGPVAITISDSRNCATKLPTRGARCELDFVLPKTKVNDVAAFVLRKLREYRPGYPEYACWYRNDAGDWIGCAIPVAKSE